MTDPDVLREQLRSLARKLVQADIARTAVLNEMAAVMRQGKAADLNIKEMAELAGVTRTTTYRLIGDD